MRSDKDNIKDIFSSKLGSFEPELPPSGWEKIDAGLSAQEEKVIPLKKKAPVYRLLPWIASAAAVIIAALLLFPYEGEKNNYALAIEKNDHAFSQKGIDKTIFAKNSKKEDELTVSPEKPSTVNTSSKNKTSASHPTYISILTQNVPVYISQIKEEEKNKMSDVEQANPAKTSDKDENRDVYIAKNENNSNNKETQNNDEFEKELAEQIAAFEAAGKMSENLLADNPQTKNADKDNKQTSRGLEIGVEGGGAFSKATEIQDQLRVATLEFINEDGTQIVAALRSQKMKLSHNQPVNFGIKINKKLNNKLSVESGITYTYLSSKIKSTENVRLKDSQQFHYLGIPVTLNYNLLEWHKLRLYISAGGAVQKDVYGKMKSNESLNNLIDENEYQTRNISQDHLQFSLTSSVGLSYPIYNKMAIYTNLGGAYYIDAKNKYETIYSDRKWVFNIDLGIKFGF